MFDRWRQERIVNLYQALQVFAERVLAGLAANGARAVSPFVDLRRQVALAIAQKALFTSERFYLCRTGFEELAADLIEFVACGDEFALNRIRLAVERLLHLAQAEPYHDALPFP